jgi:hypothetical protein
MLIISSLDSYKISDIETFVISLSKSGYKGKKCMVVYKCEDYVKRFLKDFGWDVIQKDAEGEYIVSKRFYHFAEIIKNSYKESRVLVSDCRDVYFYQNPETLKSVDLYIGQDGNYPHRNNKWASGEMLNMFPDYYDLVKDKFHLCAGVFYGYTNTISTLCKKTYDLTFESRLYDKKDKGKHTTADQMALNIVAYKDFKYKNEFNNSVINLAETFWNPDIFFVIYHQYDRIHNFFEKLKSKTKKLI